MKHLYLSTHYIVLRAYNDPLWEGNDLQCEIMQMYHRPHASALHF